MSRKPDPQSSSTSRNEYIPSFITKKPFYVPDDSSSNSASSDYLEHQRLQESRKHRDSKWYDRGLKAGPAATKYRKGACENCGAMSHKTKDCLDRPRKQGARWTGKDIQADEVVQEVSLGWDAKRDRWNGYDAGSYRQVVEDWEELERMKKRARIDGGDGGEEGGGGGGNNGVLGATDGNAAAGSGTGTGQKEEEEENDQEGKYAEESDMGRGQGNSTRQLRLREDTAKYLLNLDLESARYDPKTRSMVDNGDGTTSTNNDQITALIADENFARASGDAAAFQSAQRYAWETQERGGPGMIHLQANPTSGEVEARRDREAAAQKRESTKKALLAKYGGAEHLDRAPLADAAVTENEQYVEYDEFGGVKGAPRKAAKSKYAEDVLVNNHTSVWGSWWRDFVWGYACCHSTVKNSYCTGEDGRRAFEEAEEMQKGRFDVGVGGDGDGDGDAVNTVEEGRDVREEEEEEEEDEKGGKGRKGEGDEKKDENSAKKRSVREMINGVSEEKMEAYRRSRATAQDPMANMLGKDELLLLERR